jgi:acyl-CoA synthetase (AMP-forming)/AMP-acid ligase II
MAMTFLHALRLNARRFPRKPAVVFEGESQSYTDLLDRVERMMTVLARRGIGPGDKVAVISENHPDFLAAYVAVTGLGAIPAPINYRIAPEVMAEVVARADSKALLLGEAALDHADLFRAVVGDILALGVGAGAAQGLPRLSDLLAEIPPDPPRGQDGTTIMLHTSGTTGKPKGALRSLFGMEERAIEQRFRPDDRALAALPICLSAGCTYTLLPLYLGASVHLMRRFDAAEALRLIEAERLTATMLLPAMLQRMVEAEGFARADLSSLRTLQSGGGEMYPDLKRAALDKFGDALMIYAASSEAGPYANLTADDLRRNLAGNCVGRPFFGVELKLLDDDGNEVPQGEVGEICTRSQSRYDGYYKDEALTAETRRGDYLTVGDLGRIDAEGLLWFTGRKRDIIKSGGINVYAPEIEEVLASHPAIAEAHCIGLPDPHWTEAICAVIVPAPGARLTAAEVIAYAEARLDRYKRPRRVVFMAAVPRNLTGRVLKADLREAVLALPEEEEIR